MRHIDITKLGERIPGDWERRAQNALDKVREAGVAERAVTITRYSYLWTELKEILSDLSNDKCWYCEVKQFRSDNAVDHFRPKGRVINDPAHEGYWWLAFNWTNYRYSCAFCNQPHKNLVENFTGGKHDQFPLLNPQERAYSEGEDWSRERPELLDPTHAEDITLLWFTEDGRATTRYSEDLYPLHYKRALSSIRAYHLNHPDTMEARLSLIKEIKELVTDGNRYFMNSQCDNDEAKHGYETTVKKLCEKIDKKSQLSATAKATLLALRPCNEWVEALLMSA